jgi:2-polyprenyl-6-methoxyphenol hydroxylase-like FAD-dependent oxidoreductase
VNSSDTWIVVQGQGGAQAIEDGTALGVFLSNLKNIEDLPLRLHLFEEVRKDRAAAIQIFSNGGMYFPPKEIEEEAEQYVKGPIPSGFSLLYSKRANSLITLIRNSIRLP